MKISKATGRKEKGASGRTASHVTGWVFAIFIFAGFLAPAFSSEINPSFAPAWSGKCKITVLGAYFWRDWMPMVRGRGPDGGSPLHARIKLSLDNSAGDANKLTFQAIIVDRKGQSYSVPLRLLPDFQILPDDVFKKYRTSDPESQEKITVKYNVMWDGRLNPGEVREIELVTAEGPYLPVGSKIHIRIEWMDKNGDTGAIRAPDQLIERTD